MCCSYPLNPSCNANANSPEAVKCQNSIFSPLQMPPPAQCRAVVKVELERWGNAFSPAPLPFPPLPSLSFPPLPSPSPFPPLWTQVGELQRLKIGGGGTQCPRVHPYFDHWCRRPPLSAATDCIHNYSKQQHSCWHQHDLYRWCLKPWTMHDNTEQELSCCWDGRVMFRKSKFRFRVGAPVFEALFLSNHW